MRPFFPMTERLFVPGRNITPSISLFRYNASLFRSLPAPGHVSR
jgi:hypothetical protein